MENIAADDNSSDVPLEVEVLEKPEYHFFPTLTSANSPTTGYLEDPPSKKQQVTGFGGSTSNNNSFSSSAHPTTASAPPFLAPPQVIR
jgi:hypothetical protein